MEIWIVECPKAKETDVATNSAAARRLMEQMQHRHPTEKVGCWDITKDKNGILA